MATNGKNTPKGINKSLNDIGNFITDIAYNNAKPGVIPTAGKNLANTIFNWATGQDQAAAGAGWGDQAAAARMAELQKAFPQYAPKPLGYAVNPGAIGYQRPGFGVDTAIGKTAAKAAAPKATTSTGGAVTPATIAAKMTQTVGAQRAAEMAAAKAAGLEYVPGQASGTAAAAAQAAAEQAALDKSNTAIESAYNPVIDFLKQQEQRAQDRYSENQANLKNIFGALTGLTAADTARINDQFTQSITQQQASLATRTAEQRAAQAAGEAQVVATGAERGSGPALQGSPTATATEQGIGQANAIQTNWEGLLGAQKNQAIADVAARGAGYGQQQVGAIQQLARNFEDTMAGLGGQQADLQSQIAQAKVSRDQAIQSNNWDMAAAAQKQIDAMQLQEAKNKGLTDVANIRAQTSIKLKGMGGTKAPKIPATAEGWMSTVDGQFGKGYGLAAIQSVEDAVTAINKANAKNPKAKTPTKDAIWRKWSNDHPSDAMAPKVLEYITKYSPYKK